jgi:hypothetical protein
VQDIVAQLEDVGIFGDQFVESFRLGQGRFQVPLPEILVGDLPQNQDERVPDDFILGIERVRFLGEVAHKNFREGNLESALAQTETLNKLVPEDPDVLQLRNDVLHELGRREKAAAAAAPAVEDSKKESQPEKDSAPARTPPEDELIPTDSAIDPDKPAQP